MATQSSTPPKDSSSESAGAARSKWLTEGLLIAAAPLAAYLLALSYISGFAGYFHIPVELLSLNAGTLFVIGGKILTVAILIVLLVMLISQFLPADSPILVRVLVLLPWAALVYVEALLFRFPWPEWRVKLILLFLMALEMFIVPLMHKDLSTYAEKLREESRRFNAGRSFAVRLYQSERIGWVWIFGVLAWFSLTLSSDAGHFEAMWKTDFLVPLTSPTTAVICTYGDFIIVAPFDKRTKEIEQSFSLLKKGEDPTILFKWQSIGPLHMKSLPPSKP